MYVSPERAAALELLKKYNKDEFHIHHGLMVDGDAESGEALGQECGVGVDDIPQQKLGTHAEDLRRADGMRAILRSKCSHNGTFRQGAPFVGVERVKHDPNLYYTTNI